METTKTVIADEDDEGNKLVASSRLTFATRNILS